MLSSVVLVASLVIQVDTTHRHAPAPAGRADPMISWSVGGWKVAAMAQAFPIFTIGDGPGDGPTDAHEIYLTQAAAMVSLRSPGDKLVLRLTPNFEALTQEDGELTFGGWGEGFIDRRHPHTLVHEAMVSWNVWSGPSGGFSLSGGKGFAPYGTDDPMSRPSVKYPTNHHLSQILERFTLNAAWLGTRGGIEFGVFGGAEPDGPYDWSNASSFPDSWSTRVTLFPGADGTGVSPWELSASLGRVRESHGEESAEEHTTTLLNGTLRYEGAAWGGGRSYALLEASTSRPEEETGVWSVLGEAAWTRGPHTPYVRVEVATRPEYPRVAAGAPGFYRYDHDEEAVGRTRWTIVSAGYGATATRGPVSLRPFIEGQAFLVAMPDGEDAVDPRTLYGGTRLWSLTFGVRAYLGGDPMRMGGYGVRDAMSLMGRAMSGHEGMRMGDAP